MPQIEHDPVRCGDTVRHEILYSIHAHERFSPMGITGGPVFRLWQCLASTDGEWYGTVLHRPCEKFGQMIGCRVKY
jgi:hypothetical protein